MEFVWINLLNLVKGKTKYQIPNTKIKQYKISTFQNSKS